MVGTSEEMLRCINCHQTCTQEISVCCPDIWHYFTIGNVSKEAWLAGFEAQDVETGSSNWVEISLPLYTQKVGGLTTYPTIPNIIDSILGETWVVYLQFAVE